MWDYGEDRGDHGPRGRPGLRRVDTRRAAVVLAMVMTRVHVSLLTSLLALALPGCSSTPDTMVLGLSYHPTSQVDLNRLQGAPPISAATRVWINPIADVHPEGTQIGVSKEEDNSPVYFGAQGLPPADFVRTAMVYVLPAYAVPVAPDPNSATHILELRMTRFWTQEDSTYQATIVASAVLADRAGTVVWQGEIGGMNKRWGRTFNTEAYMQVFSDAALDFAQNLALNPGFRAAAN